MTCILSDSGTIEEKGRFFNVCSYVSLLKQQFFLVIQFDINWYRITTSIINIKQIIVKRILY